MQTRTAGTSTATRVPSTATTTTNHSCEVMEALEEASPGDREGGGREIEREGRREGGGRETEREGGGR